MNDKHSAGPWSCDEPNGKGNGWRIFESSTSRKWPKTIAWIGQDTYSDETADNARLIAGSPELLEALARLLNHCPLYSEHQEDEPLYASAIERARAAIAKVTRMPA